MKVYTPTQSISSIIPASLPKTAWWLIGHFLLSMLLLIVATWDFLLGYTTFLQFDHNVQDFGRFYYSTKAFLSNHEMYGPTPGTFTPISPLFGQHLWDLNPPHFHLLLFPLIFFSPHQGLAIWATLSIMALALCAYLVISELKISLSFTQWNLFLIAFLACSATGFLIRTAQVPLIFLLPFTLSWLSARRGNWSLAGLYLGLLASAKLLFLIFLPYLLFRKTSRGAVTFLITFLSCFGLGLLVFGLPTYLSWLNVLTQIDWAWISNNASILGFFTRTFSENPLYQPIMIKANIYPFFIFTTIAIGTISVFTTASDSDQNTTDRSFAILLIASFLISPVAWIYYFFFPLIPMVALVQSWNYKQSVRNTMRVRRWLSAKKLFFVLSLPGLFLPSTMGDMFQPNPIATLLLASGYFWTVLFFWAGLMCDWLDNHQKGLNTTTSTIA